MTMIQVVFGAVAENATLPVLRPLIGVIPEALANAVIVHLREGISVT